MIDAGKGANIRNPVTALTTFIESALANPMAIISTVIWYIPVIVAFAGFIIWNGGIVLGKPVLNPLSRTRAAHYAGFDRASRNACRKPSLRSAPLLPRFLDTTRLASVIG